MAKIFSVKAIWLTGRDDPGLAANAGFSPFFKKRQGRVMAVAGEARLFGDALALTVEAARSRVDRDVEDEAGEVDGSAIRVGGAFRRGIFELQAGYKDIGRNFDTIAQPFFINDRRGFDAAAGLTFKTIRLAGSLASERTNTSGDKDVATSRNLLTRLDFSWQAHESTGLRLNYGTSRQDARLNDNPVLQGDLLKTGFGGGLDVSVSPGIRLNLGAQRDEVRSENNPQAEGQSLGLNLGAFLQKSGAFLVSPAVGVTLTKNTLTGEEARMIMGFLNAEATLISKVLTFSATGSASGYKLSSGASSTSTNLDAGLNFRMGRWLRVGEAIVSLRGALVRAAYSGQDVRDHRLFLKADISLGSGGDQ